VLSVNSLVPLPCPLSLPLSSPWVGPQAAGGGGEKRRLQKPKAWRHPEGLTRAQLVRLREEFWDTAPHYGGTRVRDSVCPQ